MLHYQSLRNYHLHIGVGKTHYIRQRLQNIQSDYKVTIAVNEAFQRSVAVKKLKVLQPKASGCAIFFNFTLAPPTVSFTSETNNNHCYELLNCINSLGSNS